MLQLHTLTLAFAFNLLFLNVSTSPTKNKPSPTKDTPSKILSSSEWFSIESMEEKGEFIDLGRGRDILNPKQMSIPATRWLQKHLLQFVHHVIHIVKPTIW